MLPLTQFEISKDRLSPVRGEYEGNENSGKVIIFSHGFGVLRDSRGLFTQLGDALKDKYLIVRFDYCEINKKENWTKVPSYYIQVKMLKTVFDYIQKLFNPNEINIIAHSLGSIIVGKSLIKGVNIAVLIAPPASKPYKRIKKYFSSREGAIINKSGTSILPRTDGSKTHVDSEFWIETKKFDPPLLYSKLTKTSSKVFFKSYAG